MTTLARTLRRTLSPQPTPSPLIHWLAERVASPRPERKRGLETEEAEEADSGVREKKVSKTEEEEQRRSKDEAAVAVTNDGGDDENTASKVGCRRWNVVTVVLISVFL